MRMLQCVQVHTHPFTSERRAARHAHAATPQERTKMIEDLDKLRKYREYLERTVEMSEDNAYEETWELLNR